MSSKKIGLFYGSSTCYTEFVAEKIAELLGTDKVELHNVAESPLAAMQSYDILLFGIPTWDYGELQEDWEAIWDDLDMVDLTGRHCGIFGLGDQLGYADWFQDAIGYLYYKLRSMNAQIVGYWPNQGYDFEESKGLTEDKTHFFGLALDEENQPELTDKRLSNWLTQVFDEIDALQVKSLANK